MTLCFAEPVSLVSPVLAQETEEAGKVPDPKKQENMVEQFFTLIKGMLLLKMWKDSKLCYTIKKSTCIV